MRKIIIFVILILVTVIPCFSQLQFNELNHFANNDAPYHYTNGGNNSAILASDSRLISVNQYGLKIYAINTDGSLTGLYTIPHKDIYQYDVHGTTVAIVCHNQESDTLELNTYIYNTSNTSSYSLIRQMDNGDTHMILFDNHIAMKTSGLETTVYKISPFQVTSVSDEYIPEGGSRFSDSKGVFLNYSNDFSYVCELSNNGELNFVKQLSNQEVRYLEDDIYYAYWDLEEIDFFQTNGNPAYQGSHEFESDLDDFWNIFWSHGYLGVLEKGYSNGPSWVWLNIYDLSNHGAGNEPLVQTIDVLNSEYRYISSGVSVCQAAGNVYIAGNKNFLHQVIFGEDGISLSENYVEHPTRRTETMLTNDELYYNVGGSSLSVEGWNISNLNNIQAIDTNDFDNKYWWFGENGEFWVGLNIDDSALNLYSYESNQTSLITSYAIPEDFNTYRYYDILSFDGEYLSLTYASEFKLFKIENGALVEKWSYNVNDDSFDITSIDFSGNYFYIVDEINNQLKVCSFDDNALVEVSTETYEFDYYPRMKLSNNMLILDYHSLIDISNEPQVNLISDVTAEDDVVDCAVKLENNIIWIGHTADMIYDKLHEHRHMYVYTETAGTYQLTSDIHLGYESQDLKLIESDNGYKLFVFDEVGVSAFDCQFTENGQLELQQVEMISSNYPNPFNPETTISYQLPVDGTTSIEIFNIKGQLVNKIFDSFQKKGNHNIVWNGCDKLGKRVSSGVYYYKISSGDYELTKKMTLMK